MISLKDRRHQVIAALGGGLFLVAAGLLSHWLDGPRALDDRVPATLSPRLLGEEDSVAHIDILSAEDSIRLEREFEGWVVASEGGYRANDARVENLIAAISGLEPLAERTRRNERYFELGLDDPQAGGAGLHVRLRDQEDRVLADLIVGRAGEAGEVYLRQADGVQTYLARGSLPPASRSSEFITLDFIEIDRDGLREACVEPETGPAYCLLRRSLARENFELVSPAGWQLVTRGAGDGVAASVSRLRFRGVRPAAGMSIIGALQHRVTTAEGLELTLNIVRDGDEYWARLLAVAQSEAAREHAVRLNELTDGWAYQLSDLSVDRLLRPLGGIAVETDLE